MTFYQLMLLLWVVWNCAYNFMGDLQRPSTVWQGAVLWQILTTGSLIALLIASGTFK